MKGLTALHALVDRLDLPEVDLGIDLHPCSNPWCRPFAGLRLALREEGLPELVLSDAWARWHVDRNEVEARLDRRALALFPDPRLQPMLIESGFVARHEEAVVTRLLPAAGGIEVPAWELSPMGAAFLGLTPWTAPRLLALPALQDLRLSHRQRHWLCCLVRLDQRWIQELVDAIAESWIRDEVWPLEQFVPRVCRAVRRLRTSADEDPLGCWDTLLAVFEPEEAPHGNP